MKYIKTDKGIYRTNGGTEVCIDGHWLSIDDIKKFIVEQADTIEELCDEFVVAFEENNDRITYQDLDWAIDKAKRYAGHTTIYGAIWTDKGLIYVAKMNQYGELELL